MAQKVQVILVDDIDGGEAEETVTFALDGVSYEIDLSESNATELRESFAQWIGHGRKVSNRAVTKGKGNGRRTASSSEGRDLGEIRAWARENGFEVSDRGRVSGTVLAAYDEAH